MQIIWTMASNGLLKWTSVFVLSTLFLLFSLFLPISPSTLQYIFFIPKKKRICVCRRFDLFQHSNRSIVFKQCSKSRSFKIHTHISCPIDVPRKIVQLIRVKHKKNASPVSLKWKLRPSQFFPLKPGHFFFHPLYKWIYCFWTLLHCTCFKWLLCMRAPCPSRI